MRTAHVFILATSLLFGFSCPANAQIGKPLGNLAAEVVEFITKKSGKESLKELSEMGGEVAVKELLEKAAKDGGDDLVQSVVRYSRQYGLDGFKAVANDPKLMTKALDALPRDLALKGVTEASRNPKLMTNLVKQYGDEALEVSARHTGIGSKVIGEFGEAGVSAGKVLSTDDMILLSRQSKSFSSLPVASKVTFLEILERSPEAVLKYLAGGTAIVLTAVVVRDIKAKTIGNPDEPGPVIKPIIFWSWMLPVVIMLVLVVMFLPKLLGMRNREQIKTQVAQAKGDKAISDIKDKSR